MTEYQDNEKSPLENIADPQEWTIEDFQAFGYDEFSGTRKLFQSNRLTKKDIQEGVFSKDGLSVKLRDAIIENDTM